MAESRESPLDPWQEPVVGEVMPAAILNLSGIEQLRAWERGYGPMPPLSHLTGIRMGQIYDGSAVFTMPASPWFVPSQGAISIGMLTVLADPALGCAIQTQLPPARPYTTAELSLTAVRPIGGTGELLSGSGRIVHPGRRMALSEASITDGAGRLVAHGTSRCMVLPEVRHLPPVEDLHPLPPPDTSGDPWQRPVVGEVLSQAVWDTHPGLEVLLMMLSGDLPRPPISHLTGLTLTAAGPGTANFMLPASPWLASPTGNLEGGFIALVADAALQSAIQAIAPARCAVASLDLKVNYLRPVPADGTELRAAGVVVHRGSSLVIANAEVLNGESKRVALATGSALLLPGHPASLEDQPIDEPEDAAEE